MLHSLQHTPESTERIIRECAKRGTPLPKHIVNAPELRPELQLFYDAFIDLSPSRQSGMGLSPIMRSEIMAYGQYYGLDPEQMEDLFYFTGKLDKAFIDFHDDKSRPVQPKNAKKSR